MALRSGYYGEMLRCQSCGTMSNLQVHHKRFRSHFGHDSEENLIALCTRYYTQAHHR
jgi:5-methylcytosine-specific restriction endonuclease McrA